MNYDLSKICDPSMPEQVNNFLNYLETIKGKSINTINGYKIDLTMFFRFLKLYKGYTKHGTEFNNISINDINKEFIRNINLGDLYAFISFAENYKNNGSYARARKVATLKSFFKYLQGKAKIIDDNPASELESPKISKRNPIYLTLDESEKLLNVVDGKNKERDYCIIVIFLNCGLRLSELCSIDLAKIKEDTLTIIGKGNKERTVYLNEMTQNALKDYMLIRMELRDKITDEDSKNALFISKNYRRINKRSVELLVKKYLDKAGLNYDKYSPHKLRHTAATLMYKYGNVDIRSLQEILGHENVSTTQIYTHVDDEKLKEAVKSNPLNNLNIKHNNKNK